MILRNRKIQQLLIAYSKKRTSLSVTILYFINAFLCVYHTLSHHQRVSEAH